MRFLHLWLTMMIFGCLVTAIGLLETDWLLFFAELAVLSAVAALAVPKVPN